MLLRVAWGRGQYILLHLGLEHDDAVAGKTTATTIRNIMAGAEEVLYKLSQVRFTPHEIALVAIAGCTSMLVCMHACPWAGLIPCSSRWVPSRFQVQVEGPQRLEHKPAGLTNRCFLRSMELNQVAQDELSQCACCRQAQFQSLSLIHI